MLENDTAPATRADRAPHPGLQSRLPESVRMHIFEELQGASDKYVAWVRAALRFRSACCTRAHRRRWRAASPRPRDARATLDRAVTDHVRAAEVLKLVCQAHAGASGAAAYSLGLEGPPGTGKTHFVRHALAPALGRPMVSIPLGGAADISYLLGNMYTYEGSKEGRLAAALVEAGCCDPIIYFDEVDKISGTERGQEIASVLIHLIDPTANSELRDRFFHGIDLDFSRCTFVFSYNDPRAVPPVLLDRIKRVAMPAPSAEERVGIIARHMVPRAQARLNTGLALSDGATAAILAACQRGGQDARAGARSTMLAAAQLCAECAEGETARCGRPGRRRPRRRRSRRARRKAASRSSLPRRRRGAADGHVRVRGDVCNPGAAARRPHAVPGHRRASRRPPGAAACCAAVVPHGILDRGASLNLLRRMRPPVEDHIVLLQDIYRHSQARKAFAAHPNARTLVDTDLNLFVVSVEGDRLDLHAVVWNAPRARRAFHALRAWHQRISTRDTRRATRPSPSRRSYQMG